MTKKQVIEFTETDSPITEPVTKFGGQPVWIDEPAWPLSRESGNQMRFIGQVELREEYGFTTPAKMAYLFMTEEEDDSFVDGTYEPDGGENAVILQPGTSRTPTTNKADGPTLFKMVQVERKDRLQKQTCEFAVKLIETDDIKFVSEDDRFKMSEKDAAAVTGKLDENKIGGSPVFMQGDEFPFEGQCQLLVQLDSCSVPFSINFGDAGVGYAFLSEDGMEAKFLWQCG
ncbi:DUF1963 domain-containing protein [Rubripirellula reticaptiva]|uniref:DUF1963 domain-containing protein n=1 Tax=Rubripirellula reticaptiva TaxID=2528013 RepID=A0A5C6ENV6_9BACT|nr:DUF1963 domain-containing protein [Rubripirellula reticaptiva]TWU49301.1 hypothetical protein Poly59_39150 [Rubripirellula reticaptiva]